MEMEEIECSETSAYINQTPGNYPKENTLYSEHGESLKSRIKILYFYWSTFVTLFPYLISLFSLSICHRLTLSNPLSL